MNQQYSLVHSAQHLRLNENINIQLVQFNLKETPFGEIESEWCFHLKFLGNAGAGRQLVLPDGHWPIQPHSQISELPQYPIPSTLELKPDEY